MSAKRTLRSGTVRDSPPPPPKRQAVQRANVTTNQEYKYDGVPISLKSKKINSCFIDFLDVGLGVDMPNHTILRILFEHLQQQNSPYAPAGTRGLLFDIQPVGNVDDNLIDAELRINTITYQGPHIRALHTLQLPVRGNKTARDFFRVIDDTNLLPVGYTSTSEDLLGCRDFISQLVYRLDEAGAIRLPANTIVSVWNSFNQRYYGDGTSRIDAVGKIAFNDDYVHISIPGIDYA